MMRVGYAIIAAAFGLFAGCAKHTKAAPNEQGYSELQQVNDMLHMSAGATGRAAAKAADLARYHNMFPTGYQAVQSGNIIVLWGTPPQDEGELGKDEKVMAYAKTVPTEGGYVLLSAGTIKKMTAAQFEAAPKGAKK